MITNLRQRSARISPMQTSIRTRPSSVPGIQEATAASRSDSQAEFSLELSILEAEVLGLRQDLAEVKASRDELRKEVEDLRRDRDHWRKLAEPNEPKLSRGESKTWFCGRASAAGR
jgi:FtsZ-binding cell division protein ZapB